MRASKLTNGINILGENYTEKQLSSDSEEHKKGENLELFITILMIIASTSKDAPKDFKAT